MSAGVVRAMMMMIMTMMMMMMMMMMRGASIPQVVLLNHDNIYEALYDVLNQRYVTRKNPKTGKVTKMLRLAIGSRSQLCPVADSFKVTTT
jgi:hypothetical protein